MMCISNRKHLKQNCQVMEISNHHIDKWQDIVNLMAKIIGVPAGLIMRLDHDELEVFISSQTPGNPYEVGERAVMEGSGLYCETVIKKNDALKVPNSLIDKHWKNNPDVKLNMISYLGYPILFPDNTPFGTICVLDNKENHYSETYQQLVINFRDLIEMELALVESNNKLKNSEKHLLEAQKYAHIGYWELIKDSSIATWSEQMYTIFGLTLEDEPGPETLCDMIHVSDCKKFMASLQHSFATKKEHHIEYRITRRNDGEERWIECRGNPIMDSNGEVEKISGFIQDITERKLAEEAILISRKHFQTIFEEAPLGVAVIDSLTGHIYDANPAYSKITGRSIEELRTLDWMSITHPDDIQEDIDNMDQMNAGETSGFTMQKRYIQPDGSERWINMTIAPMLVEDKSQPRHLCMIENITQSKKNEEKLQLAARVFKDTTEGITITNAQREIVDINPAFCQITGYSLEEVIGQNPRILSSGKQSPQFYADMWKSINQYGHWQGEVWNRTKSGELYAELLNISTVFDENGKVINYVGLFTHITHSKQQQEKLSLMAHYDVLTQLPNRTLFADRFHQAVAHNKRSGNQLAICFLDLDKFKPINDSYGHNVGDQLLRNVANRIKNTIRDEDTVSRQGGDEFALLLCKIESFSHCEQFVARLLKTIAEPYIINGVSHTISTSCGITFYPYDNADLDILLRHADHAMYQAKQAGRNCYRLFCVEDDVFFSQKQQQLNDIEKALINNEFSLFYQPKVHMLTGEVFGAEALIRWIHPEKGLIPPLNFLPVLENTELELKVGNWVINQALAQLDNWSRNNIKLEVSINISSHHLQSKFFYNQLEKALQKHPLVNSQSLQLEILESSALGDLDAISGIIKTCQEALGVNIALDDFGTGYSSLTHLRHLSANTIKIDQSFVRDILDDPSDYSIIEGVIGLANAFNREIIAEGVETTEHGLILLTMGCEDAQGYGIAKPMPAEKISDWLSNYQPNQEWLLFASQQNSVKENKLKLFQLIAKHWINRFTENITSQPENVTQWPNISDKHDHFGQWIKREKQDSFFDEKDLRRLEQAHENFHMAAQYLQLKYQNGDIDTAREGLAKLQIAFDEMINVLEQCR